MTGQNTRALIYQLKVTLQGIEPPIWRRFLVPGNTRLDMLHRILQNVMGWENAHLHAFTFGETQYGQHDPSSGIEVQDEYEVSLDQVAKEVGDTFTYVYDFGDGWSHELVVEAIQPLQPGVQYPTCLEGERACPPEDSGGIQGYSDLLEALEDEDHPDHEMLRNWAGPDFDPEEFNPGAANRRLARMRPVQ